MTDKYSISFLVPAQSVGLLVGKHGSLFRSIILLTTANINFQRADDIPNQNYQRILCIRGSNTSSVLQALSMVLEKLHQPRSKLGTAEPGFEDDTSISPNQQVVRWLVPHDLCGVLIGKGGEGIRRINDESGAWVKVAHVEEFHHASDRLVHIRGASEQIMKAIRLIQQKVGGRVYDEEQHIKKTTGLEGVKIPLDALLFIFKAYLPEADSRRRALSSEFSVFLEANQLQLPHDSEGFPNIPRLDEFQGIFLCGCYLFFEPRLGVGFRDVFVITTGAPEDQQSACDAINARLEEWKLHVTSADADLMLIDQSQRLTPITVLICSEAAFLFDFAAASVELPFTRFLRELSQQTNCLIQLLPLSNLLMSSKHELQRVSFIAPSFQMLLSVLNIVFKMVKVLVPFGVFVFPDLPLQGEWASPPSHPAGANRSLPRSQGATDLEHERRLHQLQTGDMMKQKMGATTDLGMGVRYSTGLANIPPPQRPRFGGGNETMDSPTARHPQAPLTQPFRQHDLYSSGVRAQSVPPSPFGVSSPRFQHQPASLPQYREHIITNPYSLARNSGLVSEYHGPSASLRPASTGSGVMLSNGIRPQNSLMHPQFSGAIGAGSQPLSAAVGFPPHGVELLSYGYVSNQSTTGRPSNEVIASTPYSSFSRSNDAAIDRARLNSRSAHDDNDFVYDSRR